MISSNDLLAIPALRAKCAMRQRVLKILLQQDLPKNITAAVRERLKAEKALMGAVTAEAADREADATSGIRELVIPTYREEMQKTLPQLEKLFQGKGKIPQETAETLAKDYEAVMKQLDDPNSSLREVSGDFEKYRARLGEIIVNTGGGRNLKLLIAVGVLLIVVAAVLLIMTFLR